MNETLELISNYYRAFNSKNFSGMLELLTEDVIHDINLGGRHTGKAEFKKFLQEMDEFYDENLSQITVMASPDGKRAAAEFICHGTYKNTAPGMPEASGQKYHLPVGCFFELSAGKISRVTNYYNMIDWLKQVR